MRIVPRAIGPFCFTMGMVWVGMVCSLVCDATASFAGQEVSSPFSGVTYLHHVLKTPKREDVHVVIIDLASPGIRCEVTSGNGNAPGHTDYETTRGFVGRIGAQIGINGGFFDSNGWSGRLAGHGNLLSLSASKGEVVSPWHPKQKGHNHGVNIGADNVVTFIEPAAGDTTGFATEPAVTLYNALAGNVRLIRKGKVTTRPGGNGTYPQTALGCTADKKLILLVCDGRQPGTSEGMTYDEAARVMHSLGAVDAIALDGGGSATLVMADTPDGKPRVLNHPSDGYERAVGNSLAVFAAPLKPAASKTVAAVVKN